MSNFGSIRQNVIVDLNNSTSANINLNETWTGIFSSTLGVAGIQVNLKSDQNLKVYIDQSTSYVTSADIIDTFDYYHSEGGNSWTTQATASLYRVRVQNVGISATTYCRVETALCPIIEALPRSLNEDGNLKVSIQSIQDSYGFEVENTPNDELRVTESVRLVGSSFSETTLDSNYWTIVSGTSATFIVSAAQCTLSTGLSANANSILQSVRIARYVGGTSNRFRSQVRLDDNGTANNVRRWGMFNATDGAYYELSGTNLRLVTRRLGQNTIVSNGEFNGNTGSNINFTPNLIATYEIYYNNKKVYFSIDGDLIHTVYIQTMTWTGSMHLPIRFENFNINGASQNVVMNIRNAIINRFGSLMTQSTSRYISGTTAGTVCKIGPGNLNQIIMGGIVNGSVITIYDGISTGGSVIFSTTLNVGNADNRPVQLDFKGLPFFTGLFVVIATQNANLLMIYE